MVSQNFAIFSRETGTGSVVSKTLLMMEGSKSTTLFNSPFGWGQLAFGFGSARFGRYRMRHRFALGAEINRLVVAGFQFAHQILDALDISLEPRRAKPDEADKMTIGAAGRPVAVLLDQLGGAFVLALARAAIEQFHRDDIFEDRLLQIMLVQP